MSRLSRVALSKRSVTLLFAAALFIAGVSAWGSLKQELLPDIDFPVITVVTPYPGAGSSDVTEQITKPIENAISGVPAPGDHAVDLVELDLARRHPVLVRDERQGDDHRDHRRHRQGEPAGDARSRRSRRSTSTPRRSSCRPSPRPASGGLEQVAEIARTEIVPEIEAIEGVARADLTGGLEQRVFITLDPTKMAAAGITSQQIVGILQANNLTLPSGQLSTDGTRTPVSTIGTFTLGRRDPEPRRRLRARRADGPDGPGCPVRPRRRAPRPSRRSRSRSATSGRSSPTSSRRPASAGPTATRR